MNSNEFGKDSGTPSESDEMQTQSSQEGNSNLTPQKIVMPKNAVDYVGSEWTIETLTEYFTNLGFTDIEPVPYEPDNEDYRVNIREITIETGLFSMNPWEAGDEFDPDAQIRIYYNALPTLTIDNCPNLATILTSQDIDYMSFAKAYDNRYIEFEAYVDNHIISMGGTSHIIDVAGGDYSDNEYNGLIIRIGDHTWNSHINKDVEEGDLVIVSGRINASQSRYFKQLYIDTIYFDKR